MTTDRKKIHHPYHRKLVQIMNKPLPLTDQILLSMLTGKPVMGNLAAANGKKQVEAGAYLPACVEACPTGAIRFGDLDDKAGEVAVAAADANSFRLLEKLGTEPKIHYRSKHDWVRHIASAPYPAKEKTRG